MANTGNKIVLTLKEVSDPGGTPTGNTKTNVVGDPDYIAIYQDLTDCPITYTLDCPSLIYTKVGTTLYYEFNLGNDVVLNPVVKKVKINLSAGGFTTTITLPNTPSPNYFSGSFTGVDAGTTYTMNIQYLDADNNVLATCSG